MRYLILIPFLFSSCALFQTNYMKSCAELCKDQKSDHYKDDERECVCKVAHE